MNNTFQTTGYKFFTSIYEDFSIVEAFDEDAIIYVFADAFDKWENDVKYFAELALALYLKSNYFFNSPCLDYYIIYYRLFFIANEHAKQIFKGEDAEYYNSILRQTKREA